MGSLDCAHAGTWRLATRAAPPPRARRTCRREYGPMAWMLPSPPCRSESSWRRPPSCSACHRRPPSSRSSTRTSTTAGRTGRPTRPSARRAIVSSTPDDGTLMLYDRAPAGIVPFLRPYRTRDDMGSWTRDPAVAAYVEERLNRRNVYRGIGESHFGAEDVEAPTVRRIAELAKSRNLFLQCHVDETTVEKMLAA